MSDIADRVRAGLQDAVADLSPSPLLDDLVRRRVRQRRRRQRLGVAAGGVMVVAVFAAGVAALSLPGGDAPTVMTGAGGGPGADTLFMVLDPVPADFVLVSVAGGDRPDVGREVTVDPHLERTVRFARFDAAGARLDAVVDVQWAPPADVATGASTDPLGDYRAVPGSQAVTVRGRPGVTSATGGWAVWREDDGRIVRVTGRVAPDGTGSAQARPLDTALVTQIAGSLVPRGGGGFDLPDPPAGFEPVGEWPGRASVGTNPRLAVYRGTGGRAIGVQVVDGSEVPPGANLSFPGARPVDGLGADAVLTPALAAGPDGGAVMSGLAASDSTPDVPADPADPLAAPDLFVQWTEPGGAQVTVSGAGLDEAEILAATADLEVVDADTWFGLAPPAPTGLAPAPTGLDVAGPPDTPAPVGPPPPAVEPPVLDPSPTSLPPAGLPSGGPVERVAGSYSGTEHYGFTGGACPDLDHLLESTFTLDGGAVWQYRNEYCGDLDGDLWSGSGTFTFTTPGGDVISGTTDIGWVTVPASGGPNLITITGGTGRYEGATGACEMDNHVTQVKLGVQQHSGTFTCILSP